jgi:HPt (histidine-containing phosphotransfer) domain-containing protein
VFLPIPLFFDFLQNEIVHAIDSSIVLDRDQLRDITMDDDELMHEILSTLLDDTSAQIHKLASAVTEADASLCMRLAHYCKGSCGNVGANATAAVFRDIERYAKQQEFQQCSASLAVLASEMDRLRAEVTALSV